MNKREFDSFVRKHIDRIDKIYIRIWNGFNDDNEDACWLDVYFEIEDYPEIFTSDYFSETEEGKKAAIKLQKTWKRKISNWVSEFNKEFEIIVDEQNI